MAGGARARSAPYLDDRPPARICTLMARIEAGEHGDKGREREWLARAVRAPRDRAWIADGYISDRWLPVSPVTGAVDALRVEGAGRCHRPRRRHVADRGKPSRQSAGAVRSRPRWRRRSRVEPKKPELAARVRCPQAMEQARGRRPTPRRRRSRRASSRASGRSPRSSCAERPRRSRRGAGRDRRKPDLVGAPARCANPLISRASRCP